MENKTNINELITPEISVSFATYIAAITNDLHEADMRYERMLNKKWSTIFIIMCIWIAYFIYLWATI